MRQYWESVKFLPIPDNTDIARYSYISTDTDINIGASLINWSTGNV